MKWDINVDFIENHSKEISSVNDVIVVPGIYNIIQPEYSKRMHNNQVDEWVLYGRHGAYNIPGESWADLDLRLLKNLIDVHPELVGLLKISDDSGEMVDYIPKKLFKFDENFIKNNLDAWIVLEDYLPFDISKYDSLDFPEEGWTAQDDRDLFIGSSNVGIYKEMNNVILQKCIAYEDRVKAFNSVIIEWLDWHPEFEEIIAKESWEDYQHMKNNKEFTFNDLLYDVELPSEVKPLPQYEYRDDVIHKDDSNRMFPDFRKMNGIYEKYSGLLAVYLVYLV